MNTRVLSFVLFFAMLMVAPKVVDPAYDLFLVAFALLIGLQSAWNGIPTRLAFRPGFALLLVVALTIVVVVTVAHAPALRDVLRDIGALMAFLIGRYLFIAYRGKPLQVEILRALSVVGVMVAVVTIAAAALAFRAGASYYIWRGEYVLWAHTWLPYSIVANLALLAIEPQRTRRYAWRAVLCVFGTVASLSRTDLLLEILFALALALRFRRELFLRVAGFGRLLTAGLVLVVFVPLLLRLQVVQQRLERGVGTEDESLGWRFMEHLALFEQFLGATLYELLFGFGLGARTPLPPGIVDFNGNSSIPTLHNSFGTIALKFGIMGLLIVAWYAFRTLRRSLAVPDASGEPLRWAGRWIVLFCLAKAVTLHGLSEWSHVAFFGIGCMLMITALPGQRRATTSADEAGGPAQRAPATHPPLQ